MQTSLVFVMLPATRLSLFKSLKGPHRLTSSARAYKRNAYNISTLALLSPPRRLPQSPFSTSSKPLKSMSSTPTSPEVRSTIHGEETIKEDEIVWRTADPYRKPTDDDADFKAEWEGSCHCGGIKYLLGREKPLSSKYCHCVDCQRMHAVSERPPGEGSLCRSRCVCVMSQLRFANMSSQAPFQWAAIFHKSDFRFVNGAKGLNFYSPSLRRPLHDLPCKVYCETCHTPIMDEGRRMIMLFPELLKGIHSQRGKEAFKIGDHICWGGRVVDEGVFDGDGVRKWKGVDKQSELIDDGKTGKL